MITSTSTLLHALHDGAIAITPNNRLSNQLITDYYHTHKNHALLEKPRCLPYRAFLKFLFTTLCDRQPHLKHPILLSQSQERYVWKQILNQQHVYAYHDGLLQAVHDAWTDCQHWQISYDDKAFTHTPQTRQFQQWQRVFQTKLDALHAITEAQLVDYLLSQPMEAWFGATHLVWVCFDDFSPQQQALQQAFTGQTCLQEYYDLPQILPETYQYKALDVDDEWSQMAIWAKDRLLKGDQRITLVIPNLQQVASALQRFLKRHFPTDTYNISLGQTLLQYPLVSHALEWLRLDNTLLTHQQAKLLLHSPYLHASQDEFMARTQWMETHSLLREPLMDMPLFKRTCQSHAPKLAHVLQQMTDYPNVSTGFQWAQQFKQRLSTLGFPGAYALDSATYQCYQRFLMLFDEFVELTLVNTQFTAEEALNVLRDLAQQTVFQFKQPPTNLVITGLLEASGSLADSIWVCGLTDQTLPQTARLSAFIPNTLQRELAMPHALAERELQLAQQLIARLQHGCQHMILSYPSLSGDQPNLPSPLIIPFAPWQAMLDLSTAHPSARLVEEEDYLVPLLSQEPIRGGSALLANQAKCPFKAFASHRLSANAVESVTDGLDARERGQITHRILECLWQQLKNQATLRTLSDETLDEWLESILQTTLNAALKNKTQSYPTWLKGIEHERLKRLIHAALAWEKQRPDFIIDALEQTYTLSLEGLSIQVRIDRIDRVKATDAEGFDNKWVIDYKTSLPQTKPWREERPEAPQLLLYALTDPQITALVFAQLKSNRLTCQGFSDAIVPIEGMQTLKKGESWSNFQASWLQNLSQIAEEFKQGQCAPNPQKTSTCQACNFQNLCRINTN